MPFENATNHKRVQKVIETLDLIEASRVSNKASQKEMTDMLKPLMEYLGVADKVPVIEETVVEETKPEVPGGKWSNNPTIYDIRDAAASAPLSHLQVAMAVYLNRIDEFFDDCKKSKIYLKGLDN